MRTLIQHNNKFCIWYPGENEAYVKM